MEFERNKGGMQWTGLILPKTGTSNELYGNEPYGSIQCRGLHDQLELVAFRE